MENLEPVWEDANDISLESFNKTLYESVNSESAVVRNGITPLRDYDAVRGLREALVSLIERKSLRLEHILTLKIWRQII
jgi:hypothetical protein